MKPEFINERTGEECREWQLLERFEDELNEIYPEVEILGLWQNQGTALKKLDPVGFRCYFVDWLNANDWVDA